ncbi:hypothetical protein C8F01DRAFT_1234439 [Mycena amicta]|nr:hypothetical protein C8F01DRAFT_1234439 [Mycena amicta]
MPVQQAQVLKEHLSSPMPCFAAIIVFDSISKVSFVGAGKLPTRSRSTTPSIQTIATGALRCRDSSALGCVPMYRNYLNISVVRHKSRFGWVVGATSRLELMGSARQDLRRLNETGVPRITLTCCLCEIHLAVYELPGCPHAVVGVKRKTNDDSGDEAYASTSRRSRRRPPRKLALNRLGYPFDPQLESSLPSLTCSFDEGCSNGTATSAQQTVQGRGENCPSGINL